MKDVFSLDKFHLRKIEIYYAISLFIFGQNLLATKTLLLLKVDVKTVYGTKL
jgi:hypothetical protein